MMKGWICGFLALVLVLSLFAGVPFTARATEEEPTTEPSSEPTDSTDPGEPTDPTDATDPTEATDPTDATEATDPSEDTEVTEPPTEAPTEPEPDPDAPMTSSQELIDMLKTMEGYAGWAFWDYAQWTIGYGTRCPDEMRDLYTKENPIPVEVAERLLRNELDYFEEQVNKFDLKYDLNLEQHEFDALVSFSYNCGANWMNSTSGYLVESVLSGDKSNKLVFGMLLWSKAGSDYILIPRRKSEANLYINGIYKAYNTTGGVPDYYKHVFLDGNGGTVRYAVHGYDVNNPAGIVTDFSSRPTGYTFAGWYTAPTGGTRVTILDGSLSNGTVLYAQWKDANGNIVQLSKGTVIDPVAVTVTSKVNIRTGPGSWYPLSKTVDVGTALTVTETFLVGDILWGKCEYGWLSLSYTDYNDVIAGNPSEIPTGHPGTVTTQSGGVVNIRSGPGTNYAVKYTLATGERVAIFETATGSGLTWGKLSDGNWICMSYVTLDKIEVVLQSVSVQTKPTKLEYVQKQDALDVTGGVLKLTYSDGTTKTVTLTTGMVSGFNNSTLGQVTLTVTYEGKTTTFVVTVIKATVVFKNDDGTVLSSAQYAYGETVTPPANPTKAVTATHYFRFTGWDKTVTACNGNATYTAKYQSFACRTGVVTASVVNIRTGPSTDYGIVTGYGKGQAVTVYEQQTDSQGRLWGQLPDGNWICLSYVELEPLSGTSNGDMNGDGSVNDRDAIYLLRHTLRPESYPIDSSLNLDFNGDGSVNDRDAIYLLRHTLRPESYPLYGGQ